MFALGQPPKMDEIPAEMMKTVVESVAAGEVKLTCMNASGSRNYQKPSAFYIQLKREAVDVSVGLPSCYHSIMDTVRDLQQWEYEHAKRMHVYKIPTATIPSSKSEDKLEFETFSDTGSRDATARILAKKVYDITAAHNDRQFERLLEPCCSVMPSFTMEVAYGDRQHAALHEYLEMGKRMFGGDPSLMVEVQDMTIQIDLVAGSAECFANQRLISPHLTRRSVCITEFRRIDGKWRVAGGKNIKGDDGV